MKIDRVAILGAGAIGSVFGARLARCAKIALVCRAAHADAIAKHGLRVTGVEEIVARLPASTDPRAVADADLVIVTTKAFDTAQAIREVEPHLMPNAVLLLLQNGLGNERAARQALTRPRTLLRGLSYAGVTFAEPGHVVWAAKGRMVLGDPSGESPEPVQAVVDLMSEAGVDACVADDIDLEVWEKTLGNIGINALGALTGMRNGELVECEHTLALMKQLVHEAERVAQSAGYPFDALDRVVALARATANNRNSMLQDVEAGRQTEIDFINGAVVRMADAAGLDVPYNHCVTQLVNALEERPRVR